jgi:hypothetical protein
MAARYMLAGLAVAFLVASLVPLVCRRALDPRRKTWLVIGLIFAAISVWLFSQR